MKGWVITRDAADGTKRYDACWWIGSKKKSKTFTKKKAAEHYLTTMVGRVQDGTYVAVEPTLMAEVFDRWLTLSVAVRAQEGSLKPSTAKSYKSMVGEHLKPAFGAYRSDRLTLAVIEEWRAGIATQIAARTMAPKFYVNIKNLFHAIVAWARHPSRRYLTHDPTAGLDRLRLPRAKKRPHFQPEQVAQLLALASAAPPDDTIIKVAVLSGLRRGELFALQWPDVEWGNGQDGGRLLVRRSIYQGAVSTPKTPDSVRAVDVPPSLLRELEVYRVMHPGEGFIFRGPQGQPVDPDTWHREHLVPLLATAGLRLPGAGLHALRHTYTSLLAAQGEDVRYIADQLGHSSPRLTQEVYQHVFARARVEAMRKLDRWASLGSGEAIPSGNHPAGPAGTPRTGENTGRENASETES
jgi:integrase